MGAHTELKDEKDTVITNLIGGKSIVDADTLYSIKRLSTEIYPMITTGGRDSYFVEIRNHPLLIKISDNGVANVCFKDKNYQYILHKN